MSACLRCLIGVGILSATGLLHGPATWGQQPEDPQAEKPAKLVVTPEKLELEIGEKATLQAKVLDAAGNTLEVPVVYFSRARRSVTVNAAGQVEALKAGEFSITAMTTGDRDNRVRTSISVKVLPAAIAGVELAALPDAVYAGTSVALKATVKDVTGGVRDDVKPTFTSSDSQVATVDSLGNLQLLRAGTTVLQAKADQATASLTLKVLPFTATRLEISASQNSIRTGDVVQLRTRALNDQGQELKGLPVSYAFTQARTGELLSVGGTGQIEPDGRFVAERPGRYTLIASCGKLAAQTMVEVKQRDVARRISLVGRGRVLDVHTSDLWVWEGVDGKDYAVTGTWGANGEAIFWDVTDPEKIERISTVKVDARTVNDVKVSEDGKLCVISREGASNRKNGIVILDVTNPADPQILSEYTEGLTGGVHNVFIYQKHVYAVNNGRRYDIINIDDPASPKKVAQYELTTPGHSLHDVWIKDGIAYSSNWSDGLHRVDIGNGIRGGSPANPQLIDSYVVPNGAHHASFPFRSRATGKDYVICGDERFPYGLSTRDRPTIAGGYLHFVEVSADRPPLEVARYEIPEAGSHNYWVEGDILYAAMYNGGLRVIDISGDLMGDLYKQGREIAKFLPYDHEGVIPNASMVWGPQPYKGLIYFSDWNSGLWAVRLEDKD